MTALLGKAGKELFERHLEQYAPADPLYETYTDHKGREKRRRRELPPGLSKRDAAILLSVKKRAHYLDKGFSLCGLRFGWTFLISLIPIVGDVTDAVLNYTLVVRKARKADIPPWLLSRMLANNAISAGVSLVPLVGDVILAVYKANSRNAALLEEYLRIRGEEYLKAHPEAANPATIPKKKGFWGFGSGKAKAAPADYGATGSAAEAGSSKLSKNDAKAIKPGAGVKAGELVDAGGKVKSPPGALNA